MATAQEIQEIFENPRELTTFEKLSRAGSGKKNWSDEKRAEKAVQYMKMRSEAGKKGIRALNEMLRKRREEKKRLEAEQKALEEGQNEQVITSKDE